MIAPAEPFATRTELPGPAEILRAIEAHRRPTPRYTSYPTVPFWSGDFDGSDYLEALDEAANAPERGPLSVYVHLPFCAKRCYYCGCNAIAAHRSGPVDRYLDHLIHEIRVVAERLDSRRATAHVHLGGGTPNLLTDAQMGRLMRALSDAFDLTGDAEVGIEMDPRVATPDQPALLKSLGFTRISMGVQDFDPRVQAAIGRIQPESDTVSLLEGARAAGFESVNFDLVYGLPYQTPESFSRTLDRVVELAPDRVATFSYAHLPEMRKVQRAVDASGLPDSETKLELFLETVRTFEAGGWEWIGFDHFARPEDELAVAARERRLRRNFMGYTTGTAPDLVAFGMSGIGRVADRFVQNDADLPGWERGLAEGRLPVVRGHRLTRDDRIRAMVVEHLMCNFEVPDDLTTGEFGADVPSLLGDDLDALGPLADAGLVRRDPTGWGVTGLGRFFVRNVAAVLDPYLRAGRRLPTFSSSI